MYLGREGNLIFGTGFEFNMDSLSRFQFPQFKPILFKEHDTPQGRAVWGCHKRHRSGGWVLEEREKVEN